MAKPDIQRYDDSTRMKHWVVALLFFGAGLSGLAFFHPAFFFLTHLFGGGTWARILHPFLGVAMALVFLGMYFRLAKHNSISASDKEWLSKSSEMMKGNKAGMPAAGRYNGGQKVVFWLMSLCLLTLTLTGIAFWQPWFASYFPIGVRRAAVVLHSLSAVILIIGVIVHIYAGIWVKGTNRAMTRGTVSDAWARQNHPLWHEEMTKKG